MDEHEKKKMAMKKEKSYKRNMMFLFAKLTKEIIFVCTIFLFIKLRFTSEFREHNLRSHHLGRKRRSTPQNVLRSMRL